MYDQEAVFNMLSERGIAHKALMRFLGKNPKHSLRQCLGSDPKVSTLEKVADFFNVPLDTFFNRASGHNSGVVVSGTGNRAINIRVNSPESRVDVLEALLAEKDKRISTLEELIDALRSNQGTK